MAPQTPKKKRVVDRFIPARDGQSLRAALMAKGDPSPVKDTSRASLDDDEEDTTYSSLLKAELFSEVPASVPLTPSDTADSSSPERISPSRLFPDLSATAHARSLPTTPQKNRDFSPYANKNMFSYSPSRRHKHLLESSQFSTSPVRPESQRLLLKPRKKAREVSLTPYKVLDAPELADDFYKNLVDWGSNNKVAVALGSAIYVWDANTGEVSEVANLGTYDAVASISWIPSGPYIAVGTLSGTVEIWNVEMCKRLRTMTGHTEAAISLSWNGNTLSSGSYDYSILHRDVQATEHYQTRLSSHTGPVCGLKWNTQMNQLASGCNNNMLKVWEGNSTKPVYEFNEHCAAVKALAWSPTQRGLLASGGGASDGHIRFWNTVTGKPVQALDTGSQVCNMIWSTNSRELVTTHGYDNNNIQIWKYPTMQRVATLTGHSYRVLYLSLSPDGTSIVTGAGDETVRLWKVFDGATSDEPLSVLNPFKQIR